ncbi:MAG: hypothetical protein QM586_01085 [Xenophilus sp.]
MDFFAPASPGAALDYLLFEASEGDDGVGLFEAMASVEPRRAAAVEAEIAQVLAWAETAFPGRRAPVEAGGEWDADLRVEGEGGLAARRTWTLSLCGTPAFCEAFRERFAGAL